MKLLISFCRLIRGRNLFFILLAQCLFQFCIYNPINHILPSETPWSFFLIMAASVFIAAAGYAINDYFDVNIDQVNKPEKVVVSNIISRRWVIFWHFFFSLTGIYLTQIALPFQSYWHIHFANLLSILFLWFYSTSIKKKILVGNVLIAILTAWVIGVVYFSKFTIADLFNTHGETANDLRFFKLMIIYTSFAFILTIIREALKDIEDMEGDAKFGCKTIPIVWGLKPTKVYLAVWLVVAIAVLLIIQLYVIQFGWWLSIIYCIVCIVSPLIWVLYKLPKSFTSQDFYALSKWIKLAMLAGVLSMLFF